MREFHVHQNLKLYQLGNLICFFFYFSVQRKFLKIFSSISQTKNLYWSKAVAVICCYSYSIFCCTIVMELIITVIFIVFRGKNHIKGSSGRESLFSPIDLLFHSQKQIGFLEKWLLSDIFVKNSSTALFTFSPVRRNMGRHDKPRGCRLYKNADRETANTGTGIVSIMLFPFNRF